jgi:hypothetical protein
VAEKRSGGTLLGVASALVLLVGALLPWEVAEGGSGGTPSFAADPVTAGLVIAVAIAVAVWSVRSAPWLGLVCMGAALVTAIGMLNLSVQAHASGQIPGFGVFVVFSGAALAMAASALEGIERDMAGDEGVA